MVFLLVGLPPLPEAEVSALTTEAENVSIDPMWCTEMTQFLEAMPMCYNWCDECIGFGTGTMFDIDKSSWVEHAWPDGTTTLIPPDIFPNDTWIETTMPDGTVELVPPTSSGTLTPVAEPTLVKQYNDDGTFDLVEPIRRTRRGSPLPPYDMPPWTKGFRKVQKCVMIPGVDESSQPRCSKENFCKCIV